MKLSRAGVLGAIVMAAMAAAVLGSEYGYLTGLEELELLTLDYRQQVFEDQLRAASDDNRIVLVLFGRPGTAPTTHGSGGPGLAEFPGCRGTRKLQKLPKLPP